MQLHACPNVYLKDTYVVAALLLLLLLLLQVCLFAESSSRWIVADQGILMNGAADAVRPGRGGGRCSESQQ
jgi:long-subunit acyl-CoA synthetase (AMP-forming)